MHGIQLILNSRILVFIALSVLFMQLSATLIDYQFNTFLEKFITVKDLRTEYTGRMQAIGLSFTVFMQFFGTYLLVQRVGIKRLHIAFPFILCVMSILCFLFPGFGIVTFTVILLRSYNSSLFSIIKEMLYIPLNPDQKFRAKAFIDVFLFRFAKIFASLIILSLQLVLTTLLLPVLNWISISVCVIWIVFAVYLFKKMTPSLEAGENA